ncbi:solute carrier family 35 member G1 [Nephila pilipes]|uniref:Solute carrier family 35 member G1 n=1 Tax=Nephila pilipes TaxID=299642 RepID=A0A8X6NXF1_NEPPI|nr:solute carrier family 35 member G1 [Nephila pilipes]
MSCQKNSFQLEHEIPKLDKDEQPKSRFLLFKGLILAMVSGIFYSLVSVLVKDMENLHPGQLALFRFLALFTFSLPQTIKSGENPLGPKELQFLLFFRGILGGAHIFLNFIAFRHLPLGDATAIVFSLPVFVTVAARICLKEPCSVFQSLTVALTIIGIMFMAKLPSTLMGEHTSYTTENIYGLVGALGSLVCNTGHIIVIRMVKRVHHSVLMTHFSVIAFVEIAILTFVFGEYRWHTCGLQGLYIVLLGVFSYAGQTLAIIALQLECAGPVTTMKAASDIVLAFVWQTFLFHDIPDSYSIIGTLLVGFSVVFVGVSKWIFSLPEDSPHRKRFNWIID